MKFTATVLASLLLLGLALGQEQQQQHQQQQQQQQQQEQQQQQATYWHHNEKLNKWQPIVGSAAAAGPAPSQQQPQQQQQQGESSGLGTLIGTIVNPSYGQPAHPQPPAAHPASPPSFASHKPGYTGAPQSLIQLPSYSAPAPAPAAPAYHPAPAPQAHPVAYPAPVPVPAPYHQVPAILPVPLAPYAIQQPGISSYGEPIIENLIGGIPFDCRGLPTGPVRDNRFCDIFHACVFGQQRKTYACPYVGERTYFEPATQRCEFIRKNPLGCALNAYYH